MKTIFLTLGLILSAGLCGFNECVACAQSEQEHLDLVVILERETQESTYGDQKKCVLPPGSFSCITDPGIMLNTFVKFLVHAINDGVPVLVANNVIKNLITTAMTKEQIDDELNALEKLYPGIKDEAFNNVQVDGNVVKVHKRDDESYQRLTFDKLNNKIKIIDLIKSNYSIWLAADTDLQMTLLLPNNYNNHALTLINAGFDQSKFKLVKPEDFIDTFMNLFRTTEDITNLDKPVIISNLEELFDPMCPIKKRIILGGHGWPKLIAQLKPDQFTDFLAMCDRLHAEYVHVYSCYSGGSNIQYYPQDHYKFIMSVGSTSENAMWITNIPFGEFFKELNSYFLTSDKTKKNHLAQALSCFLTDSDHLQPNIASVLHPAKNRFFKAALTKYGPRIAITAPGVKKRFNGQKSPYTFDQTINQLLVYPAIINVPIEVDASEIFIYPMRQANTIHVIDSLKIPKIALNSFVSNLIWTSAMAGPLHSPERSATFLIKECTLLNYENSGLQGQADDVITINDFVFSLTNDPEEVCIGGFIKETFYTGKILLKFPEMLDPLTFTPTQKDQAPAFYQKAVDAIMPSLNNNNSTQRDQVDKFLHYVGESLDQVEPIIKEYLASKGLYCSCHNNS